MNGLTRRQQEILIFIDSWQREHGFPPSIREVAAHFKIQVSPAANHLRALEQKGALHREAGKRRSLQLNHQILGGPAPQPLTKMAFPFVGRIPAGIPLEVSDHGELGGDSLEFTPEWFGRGQMVVVQVQGDSMLGDAITDGDFAVIQLQKHSSPKDIVALRIEGREVALKRLKIVDDRALLISSNPLYKVREVSAASVEIVGILEGIVRRSKSAWLTPLVNGGIYSLNRIDD